MTLFEPMIEPCAEVRDPLADKCSGSASGQLMQLASKLNAALADAAPEVVIETALETAGTGRFAIVSSFGTESAVMLAAAAAVAPQVPVLFLDTGYHFPETLAYRDLLQERLGLTDIRSLQPDETEAAAEDPEGDLFQRDPDACCTLRKVRPLGRALDGFDAWANGRKRYQGESRAAIAVVETDGPRLKFNPLAGLSRADVVAASARSACRRIRWKNSASPRSAACLARAGSLPARIRAPGAGADEARSNAAYTCRVRFVRTAADPRHEAEMSRYQ